MSNLRYQENLSKGNQEMIRGNTAGYRAALGYFKLAQGHKDTPEIKKLIAKAQELLEAETE
jgi:hypothetical protein